MIFRGFPGIHSCVLVVWLYGGLFKNAVAKTAHNLKWRLSGGNATVGSRVGWRGIRCWFGTCTIGYVFTRL